MTPYDTPPHELGSRPALAAWRARREFRRSEGRSSSAIRDVWFSAFRPLVSVSLSRLFSSLVSVSLSSLFVSRLFSSLVSVRLCSSLLLSTLNSQLSTLNSQRSTLNARLSTLSTLNAQRSTLNSLNSQLSTLSTLKSLSTLDSQLCQARPRPWASPGMTPYDTL